jgi:DNA invertase Pin-like site-specific DNA recombinase
MTDVCLYLRVSTEQQAERGLSLPEQERALRDFCAHRKWRVMDVFIDAGLSGRTDRRPEFQRMIAAASEKPPRFTKVVVYTWSRFFRSVNQALMYAAKLEKLGVDVESMTENFGKGAAGKFGRTNALAAHEYISDMNGENALRGMLENARQGFVNGKVPYGFRTVEKERRGDKRKMVMEVNPPEAEVVRLVFGLCLEGDGKIGPMGIKRIVEYLNGKGYRLRQGGKFNVKFVDELLRRAAYVGRYVFNVMDNKTRRPKPESEHVIVQCPRVVDDASFSRVQELLTERNPRKTPPRVVNTPILLTGLVRCGCCGAAMVKGTGKSGRYSYYMCSTRNRVGKTGCKGQRVPMAMADDVVSDALLERVLAPDHLASLLEELRKQTKSAKDDTANRKQALSRDLRRVQGEIDNLMKLVASGTMAADDPDLREQISRRKAQRDEIERQMAMLGRRLDIPTGWAGPQKIEAFAKGLRDLWTCGDQRFRQAYLRLLVDRVEIKGTEICISGAKDVLAAAVTQGHEAHPERVRSFAREWRPQRDSNLGWGKPHPHRVSYIITTSLSDGG